MIRIMKKRIPLWACWIIVAISLASIIISVVGIVLANTAKAQSAVTLRGTQFSVESNSKRAAAFDSITVYTYRDTNDSVYAVHLSKNLKAFIIRYSERTGRAYRKYLPKVTEQLNTMRR